MEYTREELAELQRLSSLAMVNLMIGICVQLQADAIPLEELVRLSEVLSDKDTLLDTARETLDSNPQLFNILHDHLGEEEFKNTFYPDE